MQEGYNNAPSHPLASKDLNFLPLESLLGVTLEALFWIEFVSYFRPAYRFLPSEKLKNYSKGCKTRSLLIPTELSELIIPGAGDHLYGAKSSTNENNPGSEIVYHVVAS